MVGYFPPEHKPGARAQAETGERGGEGARLANPRGRRACQEPVATREPPRGRRHEGGGRRGSMA
jgi:hypothetical protein